MIDLNLGMNEEELHLLVVDDDDAVRGLLVSLLREMGYPCEEAPNAKEAREKLKGGGFALVLLDIIMPGESGMSLLSYIRSAYPDMAVVMVTARGEISLAQQALQEGAYGYIVKPFDIHQILIHVYNALKRRELEIENRHYQERLEEKVMEQTEEIRRTREHIILKLLTASEFRDDETGAHIYRIGLCSEAVAKRLGYSPVEAERLRLAAFMHDVGKIGIPDSILRKAGKLTDEEWEIMKTHTLIGGKILGGSKIELLETAKEIALYHHERWDGRGYPEGLAGEAIPEVARIVAVVDVYDSLIHKRIYKPAWPPEEALRYMKEQEGKHFDPRILRAFFDGLSVIEEIQRRYPDREPVDVLSHLLRRPYSLNGKG